MRAAPKQTGRILDLAKFLEKQGKVEESDQLYTKALQTDVHSALFARAEAYLRQNRNSGEAITLLERYLSMPLTPDDPPREAARQLLIKARPRNSQSH